MVLWKGLMKGTYEKVLWKELNWVLWKWFMKRCYEKRLWKWVMKRGYEKVIWKGLLKMSFEKVLWNGLYFQKSFLTYLEIIPYTSPCSSLLYILETIPYMFRNHSLHFSLFLSFIYFQKSFLALLHVPLLYMF